MITNFALNGNLACVADTLNRRIGLHQWSRRYVMRRLLVIRLQLINTEQLYISIQQIGRIAEGRV